MRRLWLSVVLGLVLAVPSAPFSLGPLGVPVGISTARAAAGDKCDPTKQPCISNLTTPDACVKIALPFVGSNKCVNNNAKNGGAIINYLKTILTFLSGAIAAVVMLMLVIGAVEYITSVGDAGRIKSAKKHIQYALIALVLFLTMYAFLTFVLPGGVLQ